MSPKDQSAQQWNQNGEKARREGQYPQAVQYFTAAIQCTPKDSYFYNRALAQLSQNTNLLQNATYALDDFLAFLALTADAYLNFIQTTDQVAQQAATHDMFKQLMLINQCYLLATNPFQFNLTDLQRLREDLLAAHFSDYAHVPFSTDFKQHLHQLQPLLDLMIMVLSNPQWYFSAARADVRQLFETDGAKKLLQLIQFLTTQLPTEGGVNHGL